jgi:hypothetical protein
MRIEIKPTGSLYDIVVPLRLSRENEWLKKLALVGAVFDEWQKLNAKILIANYTKGLNFKKQIEDTKKALREFKERVRRLPDELNLGGRKLNKIFYDYLTALEKMYESEDPVIQQTLQHVKFKVEYKEIKESWGNVSYVLFLHYESDKLHPLQFFYYVSVSYPEGVFFPSLVLLRTYDFSKYNREFKYNIKHNFNKTVEITKGKNEGEVRKMIYEMLPKPAYTVSFTPQMNIKEVRERRWLRNTKKWIVNIESISYELRMPYVAGTISEEVLPQLEELLVLLPPYKIVNIGNIKGVQFADNVLELEPKKQSKNKSKNKRKNKPSKSSNPPKEHPNKPKEPEKQNIKQDKPEEQKNKSEQDRPSIAQSGKGVSQIIPIHWIIIGLGIVGFLVFWMKNRR